MRWALGSAVFLGMLHMEIIQERWRESTTSISHDGTDKLSRS